MTRARITVTVPEQILAVADERAEEMDRSRSWIVAEALRRYLEAPSAAVAEAVREPAPAPYGPAGARGTVGGVGLGPYRLERLESDLALSVEERVEEAERVARVAELRAPRPRRDRVLAFERYEDYLDWERREDLAG